jgi:hypothetical protein
MKVKVTRYETVNQWKTIEVDIPDEEIPVGGITEDFIDERSDVRQALDNEVIENGWDGGEVESSSWGVYE